MGRIPPRAILIAGWLFVIAYAFPGYMNWDAGDQLNQARTGTIEDWHPPVQAAYWKLADAVVSGPFLLLVAQTTLFLFGLYAVLATRFRPRTAAWAAVALLLFPPILT